MSDIPGTKIGKVTISGSTGDLFALTGIKAWPAEFSPSLPVLKMFPWAVFPKATVFITGPSQTGSLCLLPHPYMCTSLLRSAFPEESGPICLIQTDPTIGWPTSPLNAGLPNPMEDTEPFVEQSFVHEFGHVAHFLMVTTNKQRKQIASCFWRYVDNPGEANDPSPHPNPARHYGTLKEYQPAEVGETAWADAIVEGIAECVKMGYYKGRLIYGNRTNWHIDENGWGAVMGSIVPWGGYFYGEPVDCPATVEWDLPYKADDGAAVVPGSTIVYESHDDTPDTEGAALELQVWTSDLPEPDLTYPDYGARAADLGWVYEEADVSTVSIGETTDPSSVQSLTMSFTLPGEVDDAGTKRGWGIVEWSLDGHIVPAAPHGGRLIGPHLQSSSATGGVDGWADDSKAPWANDVIYLEYGIQGDGPKLDDGQKVNQVWAVGMVVEMKKWHWGVDWRMPVDGWGLITYYHRCYKFTGGGFAAGAHPALPAATNLPPPDPVGGAIEGQVLSTFADPALRDAALPFADCLVAAFNTTSNRWQAVQQPGGAGEYAFNQLPLDAVDDHGNPVGYYILAVVGTPGDTSSTNHPPHYRPGYWSGGATGGAAICDAFALEDGVAIKVTAATTVEANPIVLIYGDRTKNADVRREPCDPYPNQDQWEWGQIEETEGQAVKGISLSRAYKFAANPHRGRQTVRAAWWAPTKLGFREATLRVRFFPVHEVRAPYPPYPFAAGTIDSQEPLLGILKRGRRVVGQTAPPVAVHGRRTSYATSKPHSAHHDGKQGEAGVVYRGRPNQLSGT